MRKKPNIILITSDQQRKDSIGVYNGGLTKTPNINALAEDGQIFDRAYVAHPTCTPARASILTGQYASRHGAYTIGTALSYDHRPRMTDVFNDHGYDTYAVGKMHFRPCATKGEFESLPNVWDEDFFNNFTGPYFGFKHTQLFIGHTAEKHSCGMHYRLWLREHGVTDDDLKKWFLTDSNNPYQGNHTKMEQDHNFRWSLPPELHPSVFVAEKSIEAIDKSHQKEKPFFIWASFQDPHSPHLAPPPYNDMYAADELPFLSFRDGELDDKPPIYNTLYHKGPHALEFNDKFRVPGAYSARTLSEDYLRKKRACHAGMVTLMDHEIGNIINHLKKSGLYENTLIVFTTDHGDYMGDHGFTAKGFPSYEEVYNIPFIAKPAGSIQGGSHINALISQVDIAPTILSAAELPIPEAMQGVNQHEVILGDKKSVRNALIIENRAVQKEFYQKTLVTSQYKLVVYMGKEYGELYDLKNDPNQYNNLWNKEEYSKTKTSLLLRLLSTEMNGEGKVQPRTSYA